MPRVFDPRAGNIAWSSFILLIRGLGLDLGLDRVGLWEHKMRAEKLVIVINVCVWGS